MIAPAATEPAYRGRFAPSPTGPLHFGSLVAALAGWLDARSQGGEWLVRMEDLDGPRNLPGAAEGILRALEFCGLEWDGEVVYQSRRTGLYASALSALQSSASVFACACSRREIADSALTSGPGAEAIYPGTCRAGLAAGRAARAWRVRVGEERVSFEDAVQGRISQDLARDTGDFVIKRADGPFAYQLAVVVDDAAQGITDVVRGADLLDSTPRQIFLQRRLQWPQPRYAHVPAAVNARGDKLSKQTKAEALHREGAPSALHAALRFLGQEPPQEMNGAEPRELLAWARAHWSLARIPRSRTLPAPGSA